MEIDVRNHILELLEKNGAMRSNAIFASNPEIKASTYKYWLAKLKKLGEIDMPERSLYVRVFAAIDLETQVTAAREHLYSEARAAEDNEQTINKLLNAYDEVFALFQVWLLNNLVSQEVDFEKQLLFIENFKWLTLIADKLMKRWSLVHVGYDTNTRQAQEDAKAKTEAREKAALENAPLEDKILVVGHYKEGMQEILANLPKRALEETDV